MYILQLQEFEKIHIVLNINVKPMQVGQMANMNFNDSKIKTDRLEPW